MTRAQRGVVLLVCGVLAGSLARAHNQSQGYSEFTVDGATVRATVSLIAADYQQLVGLDPNEDHVITPEEARTGESALGIFATQTLRVLAVSNTGDEEHCTPRFDGLDLQSAQGVPPRYAFHVAFQCPFVPHALRLRFGMFVGTPIRHVNLGKVTLPDGRVEQVVFSADVKEANVRATPPGVLEVFGTFWKLGVEHIVTGYDHLLFLLALLLAATRFRDVVVVVTAFTAAHSVTLALAALEVASLPGRVVEPAIAASIILVAVENGFVAMRGGAPRLPRAAVALVFGLIHGFGFAGALAETGLPRGATVTALAAFNLGVEAGQLSFCALAYAVLSQIRKTRASRGVTLGLSSVCALLGAVWLVQRLAE